MLQDKWVATNSENQPGQRLRCGIVLSTTEEECTTFVDGRRVVVPFAAPFPRPRTERVLPGHLVAIAGAGATGLVVWRWFDAVVVDTVDGTVQLWEPAHGSVAAQPRNPQQRYVPGTRAYLSAGLPGAPWWVSGPVVGAAQDADVELDEVERFTAGG